MIHIACLITNGYDLLLIEPSSVPTADAPFLIPEYSAPSLDEAQKGVLLELEKSDICIFFDNKMFENKTNSGDTQLLFLCRAVQWTSTTVWPYKWVELNNIFCRSIVSAKDEISVAINEHFKIRGKLIEEIHFIIERDYDQSNIKIVTGEQFDSITFWTKSPGIFVPFCLSVEFSINSDKTVNFRKRWRLCRQLAPGDKSDIYLLFAITMAIYLKTVSKPVFVGTSNYSGIDLEINEAEIFFESLDHSGVLDMDKFPNRIMEEFYLFDLALCSHGLIFGSISNELINTYDKKIIDYLGQNTNYVARKESACYYNNKVGCVVISNGYYDYNSLLGSYSYEVLSGVTGSLLYSWTSTDSLCTNYIPTKTMKIVNDIVRHFSIKEYSLICQSNVLFLLSGNYIWFIVGDYHHSRVVTERNLILNRQARENELLLVNRKFEWLFPIKPSRFEELIADIIEYMQPDAKVRLVGKTNNPDGGRDILIIRDKGDKKTLTICQCKAYKKSVNKSHVCDIRDTLDYHNAKGFLLATSSDITVPLIDQLQSLKKRYDVDWWTGRELFRILRQYPSLVDKYSDIIQVIDKTDC